jgi:hypothetical protein
VIDHSTVPDPPTSVRAETLFAQAAANGARWSVETGSELLSGIKILDPAGATIGGLVVVYPATDLDVARSTMMRRVGTVAAAIALLVAGIGLPAVCAGLAPAIRTPAGLHELTARLGTHRAGPPPHAPAAPTARHSVMQVGIAGLQQKLETAAAIFREAEASLAALERSWDGVSVGTAGR